jgi:ubiquinone/menaquinone biosynthesis C-methylase UbiE
VNDLEQLRALVALEGRRVLDVGCGQGDVVLGLSRLGADATGLEISDELLAAAREADTGHEASWVVGTAQDLPYDDATFDLVLFMKSLHHVAIAEMAPALADARRVLRDDGRVYVAEPLLAGSFFELVRLIEDEVEVRTAAQRVLDDAGAVGLRATQVVEYDLDPSFTGFDALAAHIASVDPHRAPVIAANRAQLQDAYERLAEVDPASGRHTFRQPMRVHLLQPADQ